MDESTDGALVPAADWEVELTAPSLGFAPLVWSDYVAQAVEPGEPSWLSKALLLPRLAVNPSLQFAFLLRVAQKGPRLIQYPVRWLQVVLFSSEVYWFNRPGGIVFGPAATFPHPNGIIIGPGTRIGASVTIYHNANIGSDRHFTGTDRNDRVPVIGDRVVVYGYCAIQGPFRVGHDAAVGGHVLLDDDVPPGALRTRNRLRFAGEWAGEHRPRWAPARSVRLD